MQVFLPTSDSLGLSTVPNRKDIIMTNFRNYYKQLFFLVLFVLILVGCASEEQSSVMPTAQTPLPSVVIITSQAPTSTIIPPMYSPTPVNTSVPSLEKATFISENYSDNSILKPGEAFTKTWEVKNIGASTWSPNYYLEIISAQDGNALSYTEKISFLRQVQPGETISLSVPLVAPQIEGEYSAFWMIKNDLGETIHVDGSNLWVKINVGSSGQVSSPTNGSEDTVNGVTFTLIKIASTELTTTVNLCTSVSLHRYSLQTSPKLIVDQVQVPFVSGGSDFPNGEGCMVITYQVSSNQIGQSSDVKLVIDSSLRMDPPPGDPNVACQTARQQLIVDNPGLNFECNFSMAGYYTDLVLPVGMTQSYAKTLIFDTIEGAIYGPWTIIVK